MNLNRVREPARGHGRALDSPLIMAESCPLIVPLIKRGDLDHYRYLAEVADIGTLRVLVLVMATDLEEALDAACPPSEASGRGTSGGA
jgi:hypothetical protein